MNAGGFVLVPHEVKHGYRHTSGKQVKMLTAFTPGGFEPLFDNYRTDPAEMARIYDICELISIAAPSRLAVDIWQASVQDKPVPPFGRTS